MSSRGSRRGTGSGAAGRTAGGGAGATGRHNSHTRQHSANTAGDVFAMLGTGTAAKERERTSSQEPKDSTKHVNVAAAVEDPDSPSSPSSSSPSTPSSSLSSGKAYGAGKPSNKRFKSLYTKPTLLKLWKSSLKANIQLEDLYTSFEPPDQQQQSMEGSKYLSHNERGTSGPYNKRNNLPTGEYTGALGRLPGSGSGLSNGPGIRRTASGDHRYGIQGGVLSSGSGTGGGGAEAGGGGDRRKPSYRDDPSGLGDAIQRERSTGGRTRLNQRGDREVEQQQPRSAGLAWTSNRWRHLQTEEDSHSSSGNSSANEDTEPWQGTAASAVSEWRPASKDRIRDERPRTKTAESSLEDWDEGDSKENGQVPSQEAASAPQPPVAAVEPPRPAMTTSVSNPALFFDDLLGPTRSLPSAQEPHPVAAAAAASNLSASSSRSNSIAKPLSLLNVGSDPLLSASARGRQTGSGGGNMTPTRAAAVEGLELLARRSPVQEISMAHLQQQYLPQPSQSQPTPPPAAIRTQQPPEQIFWQYRDPSGQLQGPFSALQMQDWYSQGFFTDTLLVKRTESVDFETLGALIIRTGDPGKPFLSQPAPRLYGPPGIGLGQPPTSQSPIVQRAISPAPWRGHHSVIGSQPTSRNASISSSFQGGLSHDIFAPQSHIHSPQPTFPNQHQQAFSMPHAEPAVSLDPWADMSPASPALQRGSSALGGSDSVAIEQPIQAPLHRRVIQSQQGAAPGPGPISPVSAPQQQQQQRQQEAIPSPIGRAPVTASNDGFVSAQDVRGSSTGGVGQEQQQSQVVNSDQWGSITQPASSKTAQIDTEDKGPAASLAEKAVVNEAAVPAAIKKSWNALPAPAAKQTPTSPEKNAPTPAPAADPSSGSARAKKAAPAPVTTEVTTPAPIKGKVSTSTQEAFDKQKKSDSGSSGPKHELSLASLSSFLPDVASPSTAGGVKAAPWAKSALTEEIAAATTPKASLPTSTSSLSLREIQAKEEKEAEVRRAQEKRAQAARTAAEDAAAAERLAKEMAESLPSASKWGEAVVAAPSPSVPAATSAASPWAKSAAKGTAKTASGTVKKTLKDIQEEEARRKKEAAQAQVMAGAGQTGTGKGYASSISQARPAASASPAPAGAAWTTVGTAKPATGAVTPVKTSTNGTAATKPAAPASTASMASRLGGTAAISTASKLSTANGRSATPVPSGKVDDTILPASPDLLKWCREALKGLDIPVDDFIQMLLSFPVPLDKSVRELISDSVYSSSRTLDGRHFADAFADKRSADTKAIKAGKIQPASSGLGSLVPVPAVQKQQSMAEALKFIPAQKAPEMNFKVVTKSKGKKK